MLVSLNSEGEFMMVGLRLLRFSWESDANKTFFQ